MPPRIYWTRGRLVVRNVPHRRIYPGQVTVPWADKRHPCQGTLRWRWYACKVLDAVVIVGLWIEYAAKDLKAKIEAYRDEKNRSLTGRP